MSMVRKALVDSIAKLGAKTGFPGMFEFSKMLPGGTVIDTLLRGLDIQTTSEIWQAAWRAGRTEFLFGRWKAISVFRRITNVS